MNTPSSTHALPALSPEAASQRTIALACYGMHLFGLTFTGGVLGLVALIINYTHRGAAQGTPFASHHTRMIRAFWVMVLGIVLGFSLWLIFFPLAMLLALVFEVWGLYLYVTGFMQAINNRAIG